MLKIPMLTTSAILTMLKSREDQRVQKDCRWRVVRAVTKAIKHQMSKWRKIDKCDKTPDVKMNKAKHSCKLLLSLFDFWMKNKWSVSCSTLNSNTLESKDKMRRVSCSINMGGVSWRNLSVFHLDSHLKTTSDSIITHRSYRLCYGRVHAWLFRFEVGLQAN